MKKAILVFLVLISVISGSLAALYFSGANRRLFHGGGSAAVLEFPPPRQARSYIPPSEVPSSHITIPVTLSMDDLQALANRNLIRQYHGDVEYLDGTVRGNLNYRITREEDAKVTAEDGAIKISLPVRFQVRFAGNALAAIVRVPFSAQTEGALNVFITAKPSVRRDWSIKTEAEVDFTWLESPRLNVAGIRIGLQRESDKFLREAIRDNLYKIDDVINKEVRLRDIMQMGWDNLAVPIQAADSVFFHFDPRGIAASPLDVTPDEITLRASVETGISLSMGMGDAAPARKKNLPPLEQLEQNAPGDESISLNVRALINYDSLEAEAMKALSGARIDMGIASVAVRSLRLMGSGESLIAAFEISAGASSGTIYAVGDPYFDEDTRILSVRNFGLDEGTRTGLVETAAWLLRPALVSFLSERLEWKLGPEIDIMTDDARDIISSLNLINDFELAGTLESVKFNGLRVTGQGIEIGLNLEGGAALTYVPNTL